MTQDNCNKSFKFNKQDNYDFINSRFRDVWNLGPPGEFCTKNCFNLLVMIMREKYELITTNKILQLILNKNCDLPGISYWKLKNNLDEENKRLYKMRL